MKRYRADNESMSADAYGEWVTFDDAKAAASSVQSTVLLDTYVGTGLGQASWKLGEMLEYWQTDTYKDDEVDMQGAVDDLRRVADVLLSNEELTLRNGAKRNGGSV